MLFGLAAGVADWAGRVGTPSLLSDSRECEAPGDQRGVAGAGEGVSPGWGLALVCSCSSGSHQAAVTRQLVTAATPRHGRPHRTTSRDGIL